MRLLNLVLILILVGSSCAVAHGEKIAAYCISNNKYYTIPQTITADVAIEGVSLGRDYTIKLIVENEGYAPHHADQTVTKVEGVQTKNCGGTHGGWMWFRSGNAVQVRLPQGAVPGCYDVTIELYSGRSVQPQNLLDRKVILERFCAWTNGQPDMHEYGEPDNACSLTDEPEPPLSCVPLLLSPDEGAIMPNGEIDSNGKCTVGRTSLARVEEFDWTDVPGATMYHLYVKGTTATYPWIDIDTPQSWYQKQQGGCVYDENRFNWIWKVKAYVNGQWCDYSPERHFDFESGGPIVYPSNPYPLNPNPTQEQPQPGSLGCRQVGDNWVCFD